MEICGGKKVEKQEDRGREEEEEGLGKRDAEWIKPCTVRPVDTITTPQSGRSVGSELPMIKQQRHSQPRLGLRG